MESALAKKDTADQYQEDHDLLAYDSRIASLREVEYPMLQDQIYLDHAGTTAPAASLLAAFATELTANLYGNPHSFASASSQRTSSRIDNVRLKVLRLFNADPAEYDVVFVANATAGIKLVAEAFACQENSFEYWYHRDSHTSVVGVRELAKKSTCFEDDDAVETWLASLGGKPKPRDDVRECERLFAYPAQSNMDGRRLPLDWISRMRNSIDARTYTLLDAAAYVSTATLDLSFSNGAPDFVVLSFYKIFGFPDLGALVVRKDAGSVFHSRRYFGGGTVETVACITDQQWHIRKDSSIHDSLEDGTLPIHDIIALDLAIDNHAKLFGSFTLIARHTSFLTSTIYARLKDLKHGNGMLVCELYNDGKNTDRRNGPIITFNLRDGSGAYISHHEFHKLASIRNIHTRTGNLCNPGGVSRVLNMDASDLLDNYAAGFRCGGDQDIIRGRPTGVIRISFGAMSTMHDVEAFVSFMNEFFVEDTMFLSDAVPKQKPSPSNRFYVKSLAVYPIKSCGAYSIPQGISWPVHSYGLAWDREWCLIHQGTRKPLNQKRYPKLALFRPELDFEHEILVVKWIGSASSLSPSSISISLSTDVLFDANRKSTYTASYSANSHKNDVEPIIYQDEQISDFFSTHLDLPVHLARLPQAKAANRQDDPSPSIDESMEDDHNIPGSFPTPPASPFRSGLGNSNGVTAPLSLANESPILVLFQPSLRRINTLLPPGVENVPTDIFRANIVMDSVNLAEELPVESASSRLPLKLQEDELSMLEFESPGTTDKLPKQAGLKLLAPCRRCQMITLDQPTGLRRPEIFAHMAKIRRWKGGVWFGVHASLDETVASEGERDRGAKTTVKVGDVMIGR